MVPRPDDEPVTLRDAQTARRIARSALKGGAAERRPTREQLLSAFDVTDADVADVRRVEAALRMAGVSIEAGRLEAAGPGDRVELRLEQVDPGSRGATVRRGALGVGALAVLAVAAVVAASTLGGSQDAERVSDALPATPGATPAADAPTGPSGTAGPAPTGPTGPSAAEKESATKKRAAERRRAAERKRVVDRRVARRKREARRRAAARRLVTVRLTPAAATFLCVDDGAGRQLFNGTLSTSRTFKGRRVRLNVGLASTRVTIDGKPYALSGSPAGVDITRTGAVPLPLGNRPCS